MTLCIRTVFVVAGMSLGLAARPGGVGQGRKEAMQGQEISHSDR
jgi:hypothetical protein